MYQEDKVAHWNWNSSLCSCAARRQQRTSLNRSTAGSNQQAPLLKSGALKRSKASQTSRGLRCSVVSNNEQQQITCLLDVLGVYGESNLPCLARTGSCSKWRGSRSAARFDSTNDARIRITIGRQENDWNVWATDESSRISMGLNSGCHFCGRTGHTGLSGRCPLRAASRYAASRFAAEKWTCFWSDFWRARDREAATSLKEKTKMRVSLLDLAVIVILTI
jgi:hypothetical protein